MKRAASEISVIVPIYNIAEYLSQCIESIIQQSFSNLEIILVDDGSTDGCYEICEDYKKKDSRIVVVHKENGGLVSARKVGMRTARGKYVAYVDGDDWIEPDMYEHMYRKLIEENADVVMCGRYEDTGDSCKKVFHGIPEGRYGKEELIRFVYPRMIVGSAFFEWEVFPGLWDKLFRKECIEQFQYTVDEKITMGEDAACTYPCLLNVNTIYVLNECLYHYRQTTSSMVKKVQDYEKERKAFHILYQSVDMSFKKYSKVYNLRQQWKKYVLFLMLPRADGLYRGFENLDYLFPFPQVKKGMNIILYGAGTYGQRLFRYLKKTNFCQIAAWVDRNYIQFQNMGLNVESPEMIMQRGYDAIVIANTYENSRNLLYYELQRKYPQKRIYMIDKICIFSQESIKAFGLENDIYID